MPGGNPEWYIGDFGASNRADFIKEFTVTDTDDVPVDLTDATFSFAISDLSGSVLISGTEEDLISLIPADDNNVFGWSVPVARMRTLCPGQYNVGLTITLTLVTSQLFTGSVKVYDGVVP